MWRRCVCLPRPSTPPAPPERRPPGHPPRVSFKRESAPFSFLPHAEDRRAPPSLPPHQVLPDDPSDQLELAHRIANLAFVSKVQQLERENANLREQNADVKMKTKQLERKVLNLENELAEAADKAVLAMEERDKLHAEKTALINTVKKLNREVAKLDNFKRNLMQTLQDEDDPVGAGDASGDRLVSGVLSTATAGMSTSVGGVGTGADSTRAPSSPARSARIGGGSAASTPARLLRDGAGAGPSPAPGGFSGGGSGMGSAASSPAGVANKLDGKEFFRRARARLSYENFSQFLQNIKELNAHKQTRAETLAKAAEIFGDENDDLYAAFETLLVKHLPK